jgi:uncharacterized membrane-anchored protein
MKHWRAAIAAGLVMVLACATYGVWRYESVIRQGRDVFIPLLPVDPRALLLGDYMTLNYGLAEGLGCAEPSDCPQQGSAIATLDQRGVATALQRGPGAGVALNYRFNDGRIVYGNGQAFFFREGDAARYAVAKFAHFRVASDGRAVLVGLRGAELELL